MKYKLIEGSLNDIYNPIETVLLNRGITQPKTYLQFSNDNIYPYSAFKNMSEAVQLFCQHLSSSTNIHIIVDPDVDGYTSAAMIYKYIQLHDEGNRITYSLHTKKQHGLSEDVMHNIPKDTHLLIIPDAGSNDVEQCKELSRHMDILILDHHIMDKENAYATIINCQDGQYPNTDLCGAGVVYKFLQAVDDELWTTDAEQLIDLVALANISDVMDMRSPETRCLVQQGLNHIRNKCFKALIEKQSFSMKDIVNITNVQFFITPILNSCFRYGSQDEKDLVFRAFIETDEEFDYKKRGANESVKENIYDRAARLCTNCKSRQDKTVQKGVTNIIDYIEDKKSFHNKIMFLNATNVIDSTLTGLVAIKLAERYNRPCVLLQKFENTEDDILYGGSCRNFSNSPIDSLKELLTSTNQFEFVQGHDNAAGVSILDSNVPKAIKACNELLQDVDLSFIYNVDFMVDMDDVNIAFVKNIDAMKDLVGQGISEPLVFVGNITFNLEDVQLIGKDLSTWKVEIDGIHFVKFKCDLYKDYILTRKNAGWNTSGFEDANEGFENNIVTMNIVGTVGINNYNNTLTPQIIIKDYEIIESE